MSAVKSTFLQLYEPILRLIIDLSTGLTISASRKASSAYDVVRSSSNDGWASCFEGWDATFSKLLKEVESASGHRSRRQQQQQQARLGAAAADLSTPSASAEASRAQTPTNEEPIARTGDAEVIARNIAALKARHRKASSRKAKGTDDSESDASRPGTPGVTGGKAVKEARKWDDGKITQRDMEAFDYSADKPAPDGEEARSKAFVDQKSLGKRSKDGSYQVADYASSTAAAGTDARPAGIFSRLATTMGLTGAGGKTTVMTKESLKPVLDAMKGQLLTKNVAREIADKICEGVATSLEGKKLDGKGGEKELRKAVKEAMERTLTRVLTPKTSTDIMAEIRAKRSAGKPDPYSMVFIGVNGVRRLPYCPSDDRRLTVGCPGGQVDEPEQGRVLAPPEPVQGAHRRLRHVPERRRRAAPHPRQEPVGPRRPGRRRGRRRRGQGRQGDDRWKGRIVREGIREGRGGHRKRRHRSRSVSSPFVYDRAARG